MDDESEAPPKKSLEDENFNEILPDNERVRKKLRLRAEEQAKKIKEEKERKKRQEEIKRKKELKLLKEKEERERLQREIENEQLNYEKFAEYVKNGEGNLNEIFRTILSNTSSYELSFPSYNMKDGLDFRLLMTILERNTSLLTLSLSRKELGDVEGKKIAEMLSKNKKLRRLELEGNFFGPQTASDLAEALKKNNTLRYLDLENNNLTDKGKDISGIKALLKSLHTNTMIISLNLANNYLTPEVGNMIIDMLRKNKTIINLEFFQNKDYNKRASSIEKKEESSNYISTNLYINQIEEIKKLLKDNHDAYIKMRTDEWKERKRMTNNYEDNIQTQITTEAQKSLDETRKKEKEDIENLYSNNFNENKKIMEEEFNQKVNEFFAETKERLEKKKPKKKKKTK